MQEVYSVKDVGPYDLWTTVLIRPDLDPKRPLRGFHYSIGMPIAGIPIERKVNACRSDTNMRVASMMVDETVTVTSVEWRIPALALGKYQDNHADYHVTVGDLTEFSRQARITLCAGEKCVELPREGTIDSLGQYGCKVLLGQMSFSTRRLEHFWVEVGFPDSAPKIGGVLPLLVSLCGRRKRGVQ